MSRPATSEGRAPFLDYETWYRVTGDLDAGTPPLVILHGGPGGTHNYTLGLTELADERTLIHYDQIGCGNSTHMPDAPASFWTVDLFLHELNSLLAYLGVTDRYDILGQSWGGMLGAEHAVTQPAGLRSLIISNSPASMELWSVGAARLRSDLPAEVAATLDRHERDETWSDPEYLAATQVYYDQHVCRVPYPPDVAYSFAQLESNPTVYASMNGPNEFHCVGSLRSWTIVDRLSSIAVPTLCVSGEFDEATSECVEPFVQRIPNVHQIIVPNASHLSWVENPHDYFAGVRPFSQRSSKRRVSTNDRLVISLLFGRRQTSA